MRVLVISIFLLALLPLGGCFHHTQAVVEQPLPTIK
jgi:hypothetical protein